MSAISATLDAFHSALEILPFNRRVAMRYPVGLATTTTVRLSRAEQFRRVQGVNISQGGIAVLLDEEPEMGADAFIRMRNRILNFTYDLSARIVYTDVQNDGRWLVGLEFARQLTRSELAGLL